MTEPKPEVESIKPVDILIDFLEVAIHAVLYAREVYPPFLFEQRRKYSVNIFRCRHPGVIQYIQRVLKNSRALFETVSYCSI
jgi:mitotic spindle assembly checkpoint protein MAD2B